MRSSYRATLWGAARPFLSILSSLVLPFLLSTHLQAQSTEQLEVGPPPMHRADPPAPSATSEDLEKQGDELQGEKDYLDAIDYYQAALVKDPHNAVLMNKAGMSELMVRRYHEAKKCFGLAIRADKRYANAYANLAVVYYEETSFSKSIRYYNKAISLDDKEAVFYNNRAAALFAKRQFEKASADYQKALQLDPDILDRSTHGAGVQARLPSPQDRAHYDYVLAKIYARNNLPDRSLHYLKKAMEEGYKNINDVYRDEEFSAVRKDPRFAELMAAKPVAIQD
jgi:tetratricopeptide (TPR) repeat protein